MSHVGDIGRGGGRHRFGDGPRGPSQAAEGPQAPADGGALSEGGLDGGEATESAPAPSPSRTGERPRLGTAERPAFNNGGQARTNTRSAVPAATFADALTQDTAGTKASTAAATLVMPKVQTPEPPVTRGGKTREMPALEEGAEGTAEGKERTAEGEVGRGSTRIVKMTDVAAGKTRQEGKNGEPALKPEKDNFGAKLPTTGNRPTFRTSQVKGPLRPVQELVPSSLGRLGDLVSVAKRFASDLPLLNQQVRPSDLAPSDRALRMWAFFTAYAEAAAGQEPTPEGLELFDKALEKEGFGELRDKHTGQDGAKAGKWVLQSSSAEEARQRAGQVELAPPHEVLLSEAAKAQQQQKAQAPDAPAKPDAAQDPATAPDAAPRPEDAPRADTLLASRELKESAFNAVSDRPALERADGQSEFVRVNPQLANVPQPVLQPAHPHLQRREDEEQRPGSFEEAWKKLSGNLKLGGNMLWNVLHRSRNDPNDSSIEKEKWNQIAFAAVLAFVGLMLLVILVVSL